jgi:hypothetical protein
LRSLHRDFVILKWMLVVQLVLQSIVLGLVLRLPSGS